MTTEIQNASQSPCENSPSSQPTPTPRKSFCGRLWAIQRELSNAISRFFTERFRSLPVIDNAATTPTEPPRAPSPLSRRITHDTDHPTLSQPALSKGLSELEPIIDPETFDSMRRVIDTPALLTALQKSLSATKETDTALTILERVFLDPKMHKVILDDTNDTATKAKILTPLLQMARDIPDDILYAGIAPTLHRTTRTWTHEGHNLYTLTLSEPLTINVRPVIPICIVVEIPQTVQIQYSPDEQSLTFVGDNIPQGLYPGWITIELGALRSFRALPEPDKDGNTIDVIAEGAKVDFALTMLGIESFATQPHFLRYYLDAEEGEEG